MSALSVRLNRERPRDIDAPASFVADGPFDVAVENHGDASRVHVQVDEALSSAARIDEGDRYVDAGETARIAVDTGTVPEPIEGELSISTGYGAETETVSVRIEPQGYGVDVDDRLAEPRTDDRWPPDAETVALLALAGAALLAAGAVAATVGSTLVVAAAAFVALVTLVGVVVALA